MNFSQEELTHGKWQLLFKVAPADFDPANLNLFDCIEIKAPREYFYADPFVIFKNGLYYVFFEQLAYIGLKGWLAYFTLDPNNDYKVSGPHKINIPIDRHTSYPYIFEADGVMYMIPETCHYNKISLFKCTQFPADWQPVCDLLTNIHAGDSSVIQHNGLWYMFTWVLYQHKYYKFQIFYAENVTGPWYPHSIVNDTHPHADNEKLTRGAGKIFKHNGEIYRPAQHSNRGINGEGVILYKITNLTPHTYREEPVNIIMANDLHTDSNLVRALHTFTYNDGAMVLDCRPVKPTDFNFTPINPKTEFIKIMDNNYYFNHNLLAQAFSMNTSGNGKCYYGITIDGKTYPGERNWDERWALIKDCIDWRGKNVLDIGCNMGIALSYLQKFRNIASATGIDEPDLMLAASNKKDTIEAGKLLAQAFAINPPTVYQMDLNAVDYELLVPAQNYNVAIAMSILKWIHDEEKFMNYLAQFNTVIYEGHESDEEEVARFAKFGFSAHFLGKTQTGASYPDDHTRTVILFTK